jgi:LmbE family N-acetylglucosaminyl deacetylase
MARAMEKRVLAIFAHPDDAEFMCAGTLSLLRKQGWEIHIATFTPGDKGSASLTKDEISLIRKAEAAQSAALLGGEYHCLGFDDVYILYDRNTINAVTALIRKVQPGIVFTASPQDYMVDHEMSAKIVQTACFAAGIKNMDVDESPYGHVPYLYYSDAMEGKDKFGNDVQPSFYVDISDEAGIKEQMLACHASQREWLLKHHKIDEYILAMKRFAQLRGKAIGRPYAEGFRQHLGHGYPQDNILREVLGELVMII